MHTSLLLPALVALLATTLPLTHAAPQVAAGGGVAPALPPPSQYPAVTNAPSLVTAGGTTTANQVDFTQTFAATALGGYVFPSSRFFSRGFCPLRLLSAKMEESWWWMVDDG
jgi:hypothetical protein